MTRARAMWVWSRPAAEALLTCAQAGGVHDLFLGVPADLPASEDLVWATAVTRAAGQRGIRVHALGGDSGWLDVPGSALAWQTAALSTGLFNGVHVDLEAWQHKSWDTDRTWAVISYLHTLAALRAQTSLPLEADIAFWLHTVPTASGEPLDAAVMRLVDQVTILSYRNTVVGADSVPDVAARSLATANRAGTPARLAVETHYLGAEPQCRKQTFYGQSKSALSGAMQQIDAREASVPSYAGISIHDFAGWAALAD